MFKNMHNPALTNNDRPKQNCGFHVRQSFKQAYTITQKIRRAITIFLLYSTDEIANCKFKLINMNLFGNNNDYRSMHTKLL